VVWAHGRAPGQTGGHVGIATGRTRDGKAEVIEGNKSNSVKRSWIDFGDRAVQWRRSVDELNKATRGAAQPSPVIIQQMRDREKESRAGNTANVTQNITQNINGETDPDLAKSIMKSQRRVNSDLLRNLQGPTG